MKECNRTVSKLVEKIAGEVTSDESSYALASLELWIKISNHPVEQMLDGVVTGDKKKILRHWDEELEYEEIGKKCQVLIAKKMINCGIQDHANRMNTLSLLRVLDARSIFGDIVKYLLLPIHFQDSYEIHLWSDCLLNILSDSDLRVSGKIYDDISGTISELRKLDIHLPSHVEEVLGQISSICQVGKEGA